MSAPRVFVVEAIGTAALLAVVVGSGIMAERLAGGNIAVALLANALATGFGLFVLITIFAPVSGAHFNPVVTLIAFYEGTVNLRGCAAYVFAQLVGAVTGTLLAHAMFELPLIAWGTHSRAGTGQWLSEAVATAGLVLTICGTRRREPVLTAAAVACYIAAAYWFTASTSFANPAVTFARSLTTTFAGIAPNHVPGFVLSQVIGASLGYGISIYLWPVEPKRNPTLAESTKHLPSG